MPGITQFDITVAAQSYSAIAGIIAGFVFAILIWLIERQADDTKRQDGAEGFTRQALIFLAVTFLANVVVAVLWALVSGETDKEANRPTVLSFLVTLNFGLVSALTVEAIVFVIASTRIRRVIPVFRWIFAVSVVIALFYLWVTATNLLVIQERAAISTLLPRYRWVFVALFLLTTAPLLIGWLINTQVLKSPFKPSDERVFDKFVLAWLVGIVLSTIGFGVVAVLEPDRYLPSWSVLGMGFAWATLLGWAIIFLPSES